MATIYVILQIPEKKYKYRNTLLFIKLLLFYNIFYYLILIYFFFVIDRFISSFFRRYEQLKASISNTAFLLIIKSNTNETKKKCKIKISFKK